MKRGNLSRAGAVEMVGEETVARVEAQNCYFTNRTVDAQVEFAAAVNCNDHEGDERILTVYYYQDSEAVDSVDNLDELNWTIAGYEVL